MWIKVLKGCVGDGETLATGETVEIKNHVGEKLIALGMAEETAKPVPVKKKGRKMYLQDSNNDTRNE